MSKKISQALRGYASIHGSVNTTPIQIFLEGGCPVPDGRVIEILSASRPPNETLDWLISESEEIGAQAETASVAGYR